MCVCARGGFVWDALDKNTAVHRQNHTYLSLSPQRTFCEAWEQTNNPLVVLTSPDF